MSHKRRTPCCEIEAFRYLETNGYTTAHGREQSLYDALWDAAAHLHRRLGHSGQFHRCMVGSCLRLYGVLEPAVAVAQPAEHRAVNPAVTGASPVGHPK